MVTLIHKRSSLNNVWNNRYMYNEFTTLYIIISAKLQWTDVADSLGYLECIKIEKQQLNLILAQEPS